MKLSLIRSMTRSAVFELENGLCFRPAHPFRVLLNGEAVYEAQNTNVFSLFSLAPATDYTVSVEAEGETLTLAFRTEDESFFVDASRYGLVADGETDNTGKLQAALSTCPKGGTVYVPAGRYRTSSLFLKSSTTLYLEKGAVLLGDNDRTHYPILPGVLPSENEVDEYYLTGWEGNPLSSFAGLLNITQVHDVVVTGEGTLDCDAQNGDWWIDPKVKRIAWRPRAVAMVDSENVCLHGITVQNSYSWTIHPIFVIVDEIFLRRRAAADVDEVSRTLEEVEAHAQRQNKLDEGEALPGQFSPVFKKKCSVLEIDEAEQIRRQRGGKQPLAHARGSPHHQAREKIVQKKHRGKKQCVAHTCAKQITCGAAQHEHGIFAAEGDEIINRKEERQKIKKKSKVGKAHGTAPVRKCCGRGASA